MAADSPNERSPLRRRFPVLRFLEISALALSPASVLIACLSVLFLDLTGWMIYKAEGFTSEELAMMSRAALESSPMTIDANLIPNAITSLVSPWTTIALPAIRAVRYNEVFFVQILELTRAAIALMVWTLAGLVLCRRSAFLFAENDRYSLRQSVKYATSRWSTTLLAPAIPLSAALGVGLLLVVYGVIGRLPYFGTEWLIALSPLSIVAGLMIATLLIATALGWPLMVAAIASDDCDGFGGLSRAYSGITGRPWLFAGYALFSLFVGLVLTLVTVVIGQAAIQSTLTFTTIGAGRLNAESALLPSVTWMVVLIQRGIGVSFFWAAATVISLFLRHEVDGLPLDQIAAAEDPAPVRDPLPVVGIPATDSKLRSPASGEAASPVETETM